MIKETLQANEVKNATMSCIRIQNKEINTVQSIKLNINKKICTGKLMCYEVDQEVNDKIFTKSELQNLLGKKFDITIEDSDCENTYNNIITIKNCYMYNYSYFIVAGGMRMIKYKFRFSEKNKQEIIKS